MAAANPSPGGVDLGGFLEAAGRSLADAQGSLTGEAILTPSTLAISDAELDVKAAFTQQAGGKLALQALSMDALRSGIEPGLVSSIRVRYVAIAAEVTRGPVAPVPPARQPKQIIKEVNDRPDVAALAKIVGTLEIEPIFLPDRRRWLVVVKDQEGRILRELIVPDDTKGGRVA